MKKTLFSQYIFKLFMLKFGENMMRMNITHWNVEEVKDRDIVVFNVNTSEFVGTVSITQFKGSQSFVLLAKEIGNPMIVGVEIKDEKELVELIRELYEPKKEWCAGGERVKGERAPQEMNTAGVASSK